ncbi:MAG: hypothetical protein AAF611_17680 [Bacteroidota bacterium]
MEDSFKETHKEERTAYEDQVILSPAFKRKKIILWFIRTVIAAILFIIFWEYTWVRWALVFYIPLNLFGLYTIYKFDKTVNTQMNQVVTKILDMEAELAAYEEE